jgi:anaerobic dimethyl sulfoxide reductase subunit C
MSSNEWPLIFFTLISQTVAGIVFTAAVLSFWKPVPRTVTRAIPVSALLMVTALLISFFHLGSPLKAVYAFSNLQSSWLSREILSASLFCSLLVVWSGSMKLAPRHGIIDRSMLLLSFLAGITMVYTMGRLYMIQTVPAWNTGSVLIDFFTSAFVTGPSLLLVITSIKTGPAVVGKPQFAVVVILPVVAVLVRLAGLLWPGNTAEIPVFVPAPVPGLIGCMHIILLVSGIVLLIHSFISFNKRQDSRKGLILLSFSLLFTAEILARFLFYSGYWRLGV